MRATIDTIRRWGLALTVGVVVAGVGGPGAVSAQEAIKIGLLPPLTGALATPARDMVDGFNLYWEQAGHKAGSRKVEIVIADTASGWKTWYPKVSGGVPIAISLISRDLWLMTAL